MLQSLKNRVFLEEEPGDLPPGGGSESPPATDSEKELLARTLERAKQERNEAKAQAKELESAANSWNRIQELLEKEDLTLDGLQSVLSQQKQEKEAQEEFERRAQKLKSEEREARERLELDYQGKIKALNSTLEEKEKYDDFISAYQRNGGILSEADPITGRTKQQQMFDDIKGLLKPKEGGGFEPVDKSGNRIPTDNGEGYKGVAEFVEALSMSPAYSDFFLDPSRIPAGGGYGLNSAGGQNFPTGARVVSQKDFQAGKVSMEDVASGKVKIRGR